jgi:hypothetical protein
VRAVDAVVRRSREPGCVEVVRALAAGDDVDRQVAKTVAVYAESGLTQLGFADPSRPPPLLGERQYTYVAIRDLPGPQPGVARDEYSVSERVGEQLVRLIAMFATGLMGSHPTRLKLFSFDEGWRLLRDPVGRTLLASLQRMGRSELAVPIISTQLVGDMLPGGRESFENLIGATFVFGLRSDAEAARALRLLDLDPDDRALRARLLEFDAGRCLMRVLDHPPARMRPLLAVLALVAGATPAYAASPPHRLPAPQPPAAVVPTLADPSAEGSAPAGPGPLVGNGFGSPGCRSGADLGAVERTNCAVSGVTVVPEPLDNYRFDVHIDTGLFGQNMDSIIQDLLLEPVWSGLVWLVHIAIVAVEWCFSVDLLSGGALGPISAALAYAHREFTQPWLAFVLSIAAVALLYHGLVRRRVAQSVGEILVTVLMMGAGLAVIADPQGTVGWADQVVNGTSLETVAAISQGGPADPVQSLDSGLGDAFDATVTGPWCYLEFGDVNWCLQPGRIDPRLRAAGQAIASLDRGLAACRGSAPSGLPSCPASGSPAQQGLLVAATGLERARTNGELFLALPADGPQRNSINADASNPSLLRTLCGSDQATACTAATGPQAEFRTEDGTPARAGGLLLIAAGTAGMLALFGFLALRLLSAAVISVFLLLLAPAAVLAPALGDGGREAFRLWSMRLVGAVAAKLIYSLFLGVVLLLLRVLRTMNTLGWWTQWLLIVGFWWVVFHHRHRLLEHVIHERAESRRHVSLTSRLLLARAATRLVGSVGGFAAARTSPALRDRSRGAPYPPARVAAPSSPRGVATPRPATIRAQVERALTTERRASAVSRTQSIRSDEARLERLRRETVRAQTRGDVRRAVSLRLRVEQVQRNVSEARREVGAARPGPVSAALRRRTRARELDRAAIAPRAQRDLPGVASLAGLTRREYERLDPPAQLRARAVIERELELRRVELARSGRRVERSDAPARLPAAAAPSRRVRQFGRRGR